ncbi:MAG TPA: nucleotide exchange factor GrpE [Verrucomicrobiota bacterium]|jgi:phosphoglycolate phosphatase-like HAD superfamily hydrolase/molecular chaperone GrpE (heat shock protein)|nr:nucleotide exchange factor GrpE [Verrucomicrobiota bacterium]OQC67233.1 MAG: Protein GrpE [Verrucomicrobia bacterium ADurb.Bin006]HOA59880.1 nucleotide exchange factor GrpE [Verrucomicrobiota bacterium]HOF47070.1 nucleotide exchange factor GrpE [Verrucomicrobiota bacterium]HOG85859.1 nucleotide exchange factor GrpE [Verrucomicrobiota bacterium]
MTDRTTRVTLGAKLFLPFVVGDLLLVAAALVIWQQAHRPMSAIEVCAFAACVALGAMLAVWPFRLRHHAELKLVETDGLADTLRQIEQVQDVADRIETATGQWQTAHEHAAKTVAAAREVMDRMTEEQRAFQAFMQRAEDSERHHLRLETTKLRRAEGDWLQVLVRILDNVYALYLAGVRSGQPRLIHEFTQFQNACRDAARRVGMVPIAAAPGTPFDPERHQVSDANATVPKGATVLETMAIGHLFQGQLLRRALVTLQPQAAAPASTTSTEALPQPPPPPSAGDFQDKPASPEDSVSSGAPQAIDGPEETHPIEPNAPREAASEDVEIAEAGPEPKAATAPEQAAGGSFLGLVEFAPSFTPRPGISHVLFDFDGTLSLIRQGWPDVMVPMFVEMLPAQPGETPEALRRLAFEDIMRLNGKQTIYQMIQLVERIRERGGEPREPLWYKHEYLRRLDARIRHRIDALASGTLEPDDLLVFEARPFLDELRRRGFSLYLASGTDEVFVKQEAAALGLTQYFGPRIYGALDDYKQFSKKMVIDRILRENQIDGARLLSFGDGYVEIQNTKEVGGLAVAVASDEANNGSGQCDEWKRQRLLGVGADVVIPDFRDALTLLPILLGEPES